ncbi:MAG TPA: hypothetical protein VLC30_07325 [Pseudomonas sp.]|nr:hypothetical protein [Pseudomonas sp.]
MSKLKAVLAVSTCALALSLLMPADSNPLIDSAYARGGGGSGGGGGGHGGGSGGGHGGGSGAGHGGGLGAGHGGGLGAGHGLAGSSHGIGHGVGEGQGLGQGKSQGHGAVTSAAARSDETSGLAKAMSVVATTPAALAGALGLRDAFASHSLRDDVDDHDHDLD